MAFLGLMMSTQIKYDDETTDCNAEDTTTGSSSAEAAPFEQERESRETGNEENDATAEKPTINPIV